jgi:hypothetical protein
MSKIEDNSRRVHVAAVEMRARCPCKADERRKHVMSCELCNIENKINAVQQAIKDVNQIHTTLTNGKKDLVILGDMHRRNHSYNFRLAVEVTQGYEMDTYMDQYLDKCTKLLTALNDRIKTYNQQASCMAHEHY